MGFCNNCGNQVGDEKFCTKCGASIDASNSDYQSASAVQNDFSSNKKKGKGKLLIIPVVLILGIIIFFISNIGRSCDDVASAIVDAEFGCTSRDVVKKYANILPENYFNYIVEEGKDWIWDDADGWIDYQYKENYSDNVEKYRSKFGDDYKYSYKIIDEVEFDDEKLESYTKECSQYDITPKVAKDVTIKVRVTGNDTGSDYTIDVTMIKIGASWYLLDI